MVRVGKWTRGVSTVISRPGSVDVQPVDPALQAIRRSNLRLLMAELSTEGVDAWDASGKLLAGISGVQLRALMRSAVIDDAMAREMEWSMQRPVGWMDHAHAGPLDE
jgi:hypothetical protein